jgi:hypothetical protein
MEIPDPHLFPRSGPDEERPKPMPQHAHRTILLWRRGTDPPRNEAHIGAPYADVPNSKFKLSARTYSHWEAR